MIPNASRKNGKGCLRLGIRKSSFISLIFLSACSDLSNIVTVLDFYERLREDDFFSLYHYFAFRTSLYMYMYISCVDICNITHCSARATTQIEKDSGWNCHHHIESREGVGVVTILSNVASFHQPLGILWGRSTVAKSDYD